MDTRSISTGSSIVRVATVKLTPIWQFAMAVRYLACQPRGLWLNTRRPAFPLDESRIVDDPRIRGLSPNPARYSTAGSTGTNPSSVPVKPGSTSPAIVRSRRDTCRVPSTWAAVGSTLSRSQSPEPPCLVDRKRFSPHPPPRNSADPPEAVLQPHLAVSVRAGRHVPWSHASVP